MDQDRELQDNSPEEEEESFADLLGQSMVAPTRLEPGEKKSVSILGISGDWVFLDIGQKGEGVLDRKELEDEEGNLKVAVGDQLDAYFVGRTGGEWRFTTRVSGSAGASQLEEAWRNGIPVTGNVEEETKGGFSVRLPGNVRGFCPYSQMSLRRTDAPEQFLGQQLTFKIIQFGERGRNVVLSHRVILEEEQRAQRAALKESLREGATVTGTVTSIQKFGAFVDIGGIEGLIPISELTYGRVADVSDVVGVGQTVEVSVKKLDWDNNKFSFSLKDTLPDPWLQVPLRYKVGSVHQGKVVRLANFGAFVSLEEGIDGLIHISKLGGGKRINHPHEVCKEGDILNVQIEGVDVDQQRISLSLAGAEAAAEEKIVIPEDPAPSMGTLGDLLKAKMNRNKKN